MRGGVGYKFVDLTEHVWKRAYGGDSFLTAYGSWFQDPEEGWLACLIVAPTDEKHIGDCALAIIPQREAYLWDSRPDGQGDPKHAAAWIREFLPGLGLPVDREHMIAFQTIVDNVFDDFLKIPPRPLGDQRVVADAILTNQDGHQRHIEVKEAI